MEFKVYQKELSLMLDEKISTSMNQTKIGKINKNSSLSKSILKDKKE